jgi:ferredoxin--NADP+ reductase
LESKKQKFEEDLMQTLKVKGVEDLSTGTYILRTERPEMPVRAGQCFSIGIPELAINREYSIFSSANEPNLEFLIREVPDGSVSSGLRRTSIGDSLYIGGPYGEFCLNEHSISSYDFIFIATGTGIAPFRSFIQTYPQLNYSIHHGVRHEEDFLPDHILRRDSRYIEYVSRPLSQSTKSSRVTDGLKHLELRDNQLFYLCGNRMMITDAVKVLRDRGVPGSRIFMETFF